MNHLLLIHSPQHEWGGDGSKKVQCLITQALHIFSMQILSLNC